MKIKINKNLLKKRTKSVRKRKKQFQKAMNEIIYNSFIANTNNKELVQKNASLLAEIEVLKRDKLAVYESLVFRSNANPVLIRNDLILLLESLRKDHKNMCQLFQTSNDFYNQMISKVEEKMSELIGYEDNQLIQHNMDLNAINGRSGEELTAQQMFEMRRISKQMAELNDANNSNDNQLSVIQEVTHEVSNELKNTSALEGLESPQREDNQLMDYQLTPNLADVTNRTPSIYNFNFSSFYSRRRQTNGTDRTDVSPLDMSLAPDLRNFSGFQSFDSTIIEEKNPITASTPVRAHRSSVVEMIQRPSKRISSINRPFSPRVGRPSLVDIQNVMPKSSNARKKSIICDTFVSDSMNSQSTDNTISMNKTKRKGKNWSTISSNDSQMSSNSDNSYQSNRSSRRRNRKPVSYKEPSLHVKLRQT